MRAIVHGKWAILGSAIAAAVLSMAIAASMHEPLQFALPSAAFVLAALCGCGFFYLRSARRSDRLSSDRVADQLPDAPILGRIPMLPEKRISAAAGGIVQEPRYVEALRQVADCFTRDQNRANSIILVTSVSAGEGKTNVALNLAVSLAREARVMLVDVDLYEAALSRRLALPRYDAGLTELIARKAPYRSCLALTGIRNLHAIRTGSLPDRPLDVLSNARFENTLHLSTRHYDYIVMDSPPLEAHPDALLLAAHADAVIIVADARAGQFGRIRAAVNKLKQVNARCAGIVFNRVNSQ